MLVSYNRAHEHKPSRCLCLSVTVRSVIDRPRWLVTTVGKPDTWKQRHGETWRGEKSPWRRI